MSGFVIALGFGMALASVHKDLLQTISAQITPTPASDWKDLHGWIWADPVGWISANGNQLGACARDGGACNTSYRLLVNTRDAATHEIQGWAWNDGVGWICFGQTCKTAGAPCLSTPPTGLASDMRAGVQIDPTSGISPVRGWAHICSLGEDGWISLNLQDPLDHVPPLENPSAAVQKCPYRAYLNTPTDPRYFGQPPSVTVNTSACETRRVLNWPKWSYAWNGSRSSAIGIGYLDFRHVYFEGTEGSLSVQIVVDQNMITVPETGSAVVNVALTTQPGKDIVLSVTRVGDADIQPAVTSLTFTSTNWNVAQALVVRGAKDADTLNGTATITLTGPTGIDPVAIGATEKDNDVPPPPGSPDLMVYPTTLSVPEGGSSNLNVGLTAQPAGNVTVNLTALSGFDTDVYIPARVTILRADWNKVTPIKVTAAKDADAVNGEMTVDVSAAGMSTTRVKLVEADSDILMCGNGLDDDLSGKTDCSDAKCCGVAACSGSSACAEPKCVDGTSGVALGADACCHNGIDDNTNGQTDCADTACSLLTEANCTEMYCADGVDNDRDGAIDCADTDCASKPECACTTPGSCPGEPGCGLGAHACCSNDVDDDRRNGKDCASDTECIKQDPLCTPLWIDVKYGNILAKQGIQGDAVQQSTATYCLYSQGTIAGFSSAAGCTLESTFKGPIARIDKKGILSGRYGTVYLMAPGSQMATALDGKVYLGGSVYVYDGNATLNGMTMANAKLATGKGSGLIVVKGDLTINGNIVYDTDTLPNALRNLASLGILVVKRDDGTGGNVKINGNVGIVSASIYAAGDVSTGTTGDRTTEKPFKLYGLVVARKVNLQRQYRDPTRKVADENFFFDGRAIANPPPGLQDTEQSLPLIQEGF